MKKHRKFIVKLKRSGNRAAEYVQRIDPAPIHMTTQPQAGTRNGKIYGRGWIQCFLQNSRTFLELESVQVLA